MSAILVTVAANTSKLPITKVHAIVTADFPITGNEAAEAVIEKLENRHNLEREFSLHIIIYDSNDYAQALETLNLFNQQKEYRQTRKYQYESSVKEAMQNRAV